MLWTCFVAKIYIIVSNVRKGEGGMSLRFQKILNSVRLLFSIQKSRPPNIIDRISPLYIISIQWYLQQTAEISG